MRAKRPGSGRLSINDIVERFPQVKLKRPPFHKPKPPSEAMIRKLNQLHIDITEGKVYNWDGRELGKPDKNGRVHISVASGNGKFEEWRLFRRAHIIWWKHTGQWPTLTIDHIDIDCGNDRISNLREATMKVQNDNRKRRPKSD